jgi:ABC-2 type transport system permease protein
MRYGVLLMQSNPNDLLIKYNCNKLEDVFLKLCQQSTNKRKDSKAIEENFEIQVKKVDKTSKVIINTSAKDSKTFLDSNHMKALIWKSYIRIKRNPFILVLFHFIPIAIIVLMILCFARLPHSFPVAVYNGEQEPNLSKLFIEQINKKLIKINYHNTNESAFTSVVKGKSWYAISFEKNFSESFRIRVLEPEVLTDEELEYSNIKLYADMSNAFAGLHIYEYLLVSFRKFLEKFSATLGFSPIAFSIPVLVEEPVYGKNEWLFYESLAPGILVGAFHALPMIFAAFSIVVERRDGHIDRAFVAGIKPFEILLTHIITIFIAIISSVLLSMLVAFVIFDIPLKGPVIDVFGLLVMQSLEGMSFGLFISFVVPDVVFASVSYLSIFNYL